MKNERDDPSGPSLYCQNCAASNPPPPVPGWLPPPPAANAAGATPPINVAAATTAAADRRQSLLREPRPRLCCCSAMGTKPSCCLPSKTGCNHPAACAVGATTLLFGVRHAAENQTNCFHYMLPLLYQTCAEENTQAMPDKQKNRQMCVWYVPLQGLNGLCIVCKANPCRRGWSA